MKLQDRLNFITYNNNNNNNKRRSSEQQHVQKEKSSFMTCSLYSVGTPDQDENHVHSPYERRRAFDFPVSRLSSVYTAGFSSRQLLRLNADYSSSFLFLGFVLLFVLFLLQCKWSNIVEKMNVSSANMGFTHTEFQNERL